ncbi:MAG: hypothetical protein DRJ03_16175 [Chloroflexi bacterium]|nr:MAG: hypothetical protein B6I35_07930 [Anaerolineaceae bacterium 4572_32.2]RLC77335.1 MAG: hypothetical protein DRI81_08730 [Chloroflexota bacterium]RLC83766.1 MAG: hypothetical protein DRJ03_16175 [Chloroflexota bacterium]HEY73753.1 cellulase family glycosylhydrolase [Thermoflexia bacterium]
MENRKWQIILFVAAIVGATVGTLLCYLALSGRAAEAQWTNLRNQVFATAFTEKPGFSSVLTFTPVMTVYLPLAARNSFDKWSLWSGSIQLRGANIYQRRVYPELDGTEFMGSGPVGPPYTQADLYDLAALGANYVNISHPGLFAETAPYTVELDIQNNLDNLLTMIANADMFAVISFRTGPGRAEFSVCCLGDDWFADSYYNDSVWGDPAAQDAWSAMWSYTAQRYKDNPIVVGYDLMVEPNSNEVGDDATNLLDVWDPEEFYANYGGTLYDWNQLYPDISTAIRQVDASTPILIGAMAYSAVEWLPYLQPTGDPRTVYTVHQYEQFDYTHQEPSSSVAYPSGSFDRDWLDDLLTTVDDFKSTHNALVAVNEFGVHRWAPGADVFMDDQMDLFEQRDMNHALWVWDPAWEAWTDEVNAFNFRFGPDPGNDSNVPNDLRDAILKYWGRNAAGASLAPPPALTSTSVATNYLPLVQRNSGAPSLAGVTYWAYQIQDINEPDMVDALTASHYDMLVLEPTRTDWSSDDKYFDTWGMVTQLKNSKGSDGAHRKLIVAYIDIGEAEDWRWYWDQSWPEWDCTGDPPAEWPDYILICDPDGWSGNYPVAYWDEDWKDIIIYGANTGSHPDRNYGSVIDEAIKDGFDGIYLDWVEAFEDKHVIAAAQAAGKDPASEMIAFIQEMRDYATARNPDFVIIQQNAASLIDGHHELGSVIDAIAQEAIWYDGSADVDWDDPQGYDWENGPDLIDYYNGYLAQYLAAGLPVFDCEYALNYADTAYANALDKGYTPYATRRSLSQLTTTPPPGY